MITSYHGLGVIQIAILQLLTDEQYERAIVYSEIRYAHYKSSTKAQSRQAIKRAIKTLKQHGLIEEHFGILGLK